MRNRAPPVAEARGLTDWRGPDDDRGFGTAPVSLCVTSREAASHADPRTTMHDDRARVSLDRHATHIVAAFVAGAAR